MDDKEHASRPRHAAAAHPSAMSTPTQEAQSRSSLGNATIRAAPDYLGNGARPTFLCDSSDGGHKSGSTIWSASCPVAFSSSTHFSGGGLSRPADGSGESGYRGGGKTVTTWEKNMLQLQQQQDEQSQQREIDAFPAAAAGSPCSFPASCSPRSGPDRPQGLPTKATATRAAATKATSARASSASLVYRKRGTTNPTSRRPVS